MESAFLFLIVIIVLAWLYDFYNGANDSANAIATIVSTRVLTPVQALLFAGVLNGAGAFVSTRVAKTIGKGIVDPSLLGGIILVSAISGAIIWVAFSTRMGMPVSVTHSIVGGIIGAVWIPHGLSIVKLAGIKKILLGMIFSPIFGFLIAGVFLVFLYALSKNFRPSSAQKGYGRLQILSSGFMAFSHGTNDTQNAMGIITIALFTGGFIQTFEVPFWVIAGSGLFMALGTYFGGRRVIKTLGNKVVRLKPVHGFAAETAATGVISAASYLGIPISTTHAITGSIVGVGAAERTRAVRWNVAKQIAQAWIFTIPGAMLSAALVYGFLQIII